MTNNKAEAYGLLLGLKILREKKIKEVIVFGNLSIIIKAMASNSLPKIVGLNQILSRAQKIANQIGNIEFFHILRKNNKMADEQAKMGAQWNGGQAQIGEIISQIHIP